MKTKSILIDSMLCLYSVCYNTVWTPTLCLPDMSDRPCDFLFNLLNLAMSLYHMWCALPFTFIVLHFVIILLHL